MAKVDRLRVQATRNGYYGNIRRYEGEVFFLVPKKGKRRDPKTGKEREVVYSPEDQFSESWMEKVGDGEVKPLPEKKAADKLPPGMKGRSPHAGAKIAPEGRGAVGRTAGQRAAPPVEPVEEADESDEDQDEDDGTK